MSAKPQIVRWICTCSAQTYQRRAGVDCCCWFLRTRAFPHRISFLPKTELPSLSSSILSPEFLMRKPCRLIGTGGRLAVILGGTSKGSQRRKILLSDPAAFKTHAACILLACFMFGLGVNKAVKTPVASWTPARFSTVAWRHELSLCLEVASLSQFRPKYLNGCCDIFLGVLWFSTFQIGSLFRNCTAIKAPKRIVRSRN